MFVCVFIFISTFVMEKDGNELTGTIPSQLSVCCKDKTEKPTIGDRCSNEINLSKFV